MGGQPRLRRPRGRGLAGPSRAATGRPATSTSSPSAPPKRPSGQVGSSTEHGLELSAVAYYENNLHADPARREATHDHLRRCIDAAAAARGAASSAPSSGATSTRTVAREPAARPSRCCRRWSSTPPPAAYGWSSRTARWRAGTPTATRPTSPTRPSCGSGWPTSGCGSTSTPRTWSGSASTRSPRSTAHVDRVLHVQAKDVEVDAAGPQPLRRLRPGRSTGVAVGERLVALPDPGPRRGRLAPASSARSPRRGYDGVVSVEHEDPVWSGDPERVRHGLAIAQRTLDPYVNA